VAVLAREAHRRLCTIEAQRKDVLAGKLDPGYQLLPKQNLEQVELMRRQRGEIHDALAAGDEGARGDSGPVNQDSGCAGRIHFIL
jgi:hypothetical protein